MKWGIVITLLMCGTSSQAQKTILYYKKGKKTVSSYFVGSTITFLLKDREWEKGVIKKITSDSIYIQPSLVRYYMMGTDTVTFNTIGFPLANIYAMLRRGYQVDYKDGRFQINRAGGHQHFYWIKSGWIFRAGATGYLTVAVFNSLTSKNNKLTAQDVAYSAGVFAFGCLLKHTYKPWHRIGKKYHFKVLSY